MKIKFAFTLTTALLVLVCNAWAEDTATPATSATAASAVSSEESAKETAVAAAARYPLEKCIVTGEKLGEMGDPVVKNYDGREVKFCCKMCVKGFEKDQAKWMKKLDEELIAVQSKSYPTDMCVVGGEKLGSMGDPVNYMYKNQLVKLCCSGCIEKLEKDPEMYLQKLHPKAAEPEKTTE